MKTHRWIWLMVALAAGIVLVIAIRNLKRSSSTSTKVTIAQWGQERYLIYLPVYIAQEQGLFKTKGLDVKITFNGNDDQVFATVARGDAQFGVGDPIFTAVSRQRGFDGIVVASIVDRVALWGVTKRQQSYTDPGSFANTAVGTFPRPSTTYTLVKQMIDAHNIQGARIVEIAIGNELALLESGNADVVMLLEPAASIAEAKGYNIATSFPKLWGPFAFTGLTTTERYRNENRSVVKSMQAALAEATALAHEKPEVAIAVAVKLFPNLDRSILERAVNRMLADQTIPMRIAVSRDAWKKAVAVRQSIGDLKSGHDFLECISE